MMIDKQLKDLINTTYNSSKEIMKEVKETFSNDKKNDGIAPVKNIDNSEKLNIDVNAIHTNNENTEEHELNINTNSIKYDSVDKTLDVKINNPNIKQ